MIYFTGFMLFFVIGLLWNMKPPSGLRESKNAFDA